VHIPRSGVPGRLAYIWLRRRRFIRLFAISSSSLRCSAWSSSSTWRCMALIRLAHSARSSSARGMSKLCGRLAGAEAMVTSRGGRRSARRRGHGPRVVK
jgi:hypothetical protein